MDSWLETVYRKTRIINKWDSQVRAQPRHLPVVDALITHNLWDEEVLEFEEVFLRDSFIKICEFLGKNLVSDAFARLEVGAHYEICVIFVGKLKLNNIRLWFV